MKKPNAVFKRGAVGSKRIAPVNMKKEEHQFVIDAYLVDEVLANIPESVKIVGGQIILLKEEGGGKIIVPNSMRKLGISTIYQKPKLTYAHLTFDQISKNGLKNAVNEASKMGDFERKKCYFKYLLLSNGKGTVRFNHVTKEIKPYETDLRKKLRVLGATLGQGQVQSVIADISAKKYRCVIKEEPVKFVMCYKE